VDIDDLLSRGGMDSMMWTVNLIICAMMFGGIMDSSGMLATLAEAMLKLARNVGALVTVTVFSCIVMNIIASDQYLSIILTGRMYREAFEDMRLKNKNLSRCLEDSGTLTSPLVPWNTCGATMSNFLDVPTVRYAPFAFLNLINPIISIIYGFTGISMEKMTEEEYQAVLENRKIDKEAALRAAEA
jgi:NhaC family Na+:H+ antiporter